MSTQRRRVLEDSKKLIIPADGVYIEGLDRKAYTVDEWQGGYAANSVIVASGDVKFRIALTQASSIMAISSSYEDPLENYMRAIPSVTKALADYNGAGNTAKILQMQPSTGYAAGYCDAFIFPDGKTMGYLPSLGQLNLACQNKMDVDAALSKCGGTAMADSYYWSSTFWGVDDISRHCWFLYWRHGTVRNFYLDGRYDVRPFADIS